MIGEREQHKAVPEQTIFGRFFRHAAARTVQVGMLNHIRDFQTKQYNLRGRQNDNQTKRNRGPDSIDEGRGGGTRGINAKANDKGQQAHGADGAPDGCGPPVDEGVGHKTVGQHKHAQKAGQPQYAHGNAQKQPAHERKVRDHFVVHVDVGKTQRLGTVR